jgi:hypothetical protein
VSKVLPPKGGQHHGHSTLFGLGSALPFSLLQIPGSPLSRNTSAQLRLSLSTAQSNSAVHLASGHRLLCSLLPLCRLRPTGTLGEGAGGPVWGQPLIPNFPFPLDRYTYTVYSPGVTEKQLKLLEGIARWKETQGRWPSFREMARERGVTVGAVQKMVAHLVREDLLRVTGKRHGFWVTEKGLRLLGSRAESSWDGA